MILGALTVRTAMLSSNAVAEADRREFAIHLSPGRMTYDLRRLRVHGLIERIPRSRRYRVTARGIRVALCYQRTYARVLRPTLEAVFDRNPPRSNRLQRTVETFDREIDRLCIMPSPAGLRGASEARTRAATAASFSGSR